MADLKTPKKRLALASGQPHVEKLWTGAALIYQRPEEKGQPGKWTARLTHKEAGQKRDKIGLADDFTSSDGLTIFSYDEAKEKASEIIKRLNQEIEEKISGRVIVKNYKVKDAIADFIDYLKYNNKKSLKNYVIMTNAHILPELGEILANRLSKQRVEKWRYDLAEKPRSITVKYKDRTEKKLADPPKTEDEKRKRQLSSNIVLSYLQMAMNHAISNGRIEHPLSGSWKDVKPYKGAAYTVRDWLTPNECKILIDACENEDFRNLVIAGIKTGGRYSELAKLTVQDYNKDNKTLRFGPFGKTRGLIRYIALDDEDIAFFDKMVEGKRNTDIIFTRTTKRKAYNVGKGLDGIWANQDQAFFFRKAVKKAGLSPRLTFHCLRHSMISHLVMAGVPLPFIANQSGHSTIVQIEKRYGHLIPKGVQDVIRSSKPRILS